MALIKLDFTNVKEISNLPVGKQVLKVTKAEQDTSSTGSQMIKVTLVNGQGDTGIDYFVLTENALWKLQGFLKCVFKQEFKGVVDLNLDSLIGKTVEATVKEEEYMKNDGTPGIRTTIDNYRPIVADGVPVGPGAPVQPMTPPVAPTTPPVAPQTGVPVQQTFTAPVQQAPVQQPVFEQPQQAPVQQPVTEEPARPKRPWE